MTFFDTIMLFLTSKAPAPTMFGALHIVTLILCVVLTVLLCVFFKNSKDKVFRKVTFIFWIIVVVFEIYKQLIYSFNYNETTNEVVWKYLPSQFPFQLCSMPLYVWPLLVFLKDGKVRDSLLAFNITFSFFGGLCTVIYPGDVFHEIIGRNVQTLLHHGLQVVSGIFTFVFYRKKANFKFFALGIIPFIIALIMALSMNAIVEACYPNENGSKFWFNMFYLSPKLGCSLPILNTIYGVYPKDRIIPYPAFLLIYTFGFVLVAFIMFVSMYGIYKLVKFIKKDKVNAN